MFQEPSALLDTDADNKARDADAALQELGSDLVAYGYVTTTLTVASEDPQTAEDRARQAERIINGKGFTVIAETLNAVEAWLGSLPGHAYANVRQPILNTLNLAHMVPLSAVWAGDRQNRHLAAPALIEARTDGTRRRQRARPTSGSMPAAQNSAAPGVRNPRMAKHRFLPSSSMIRALSGRCAPLSSKTRRKAPVSSSGTARNNSEAQQPRRLPRHMIKERKHRAEVFNVPPWRTP